MTIFELAKFFDHSILAPTATDQDLEAGCHYAAEVGTASVCIKPYAVPRAKQILLGTGVAIGTVIGFPHGSHCTKIKQLEAEQALDDGANELDMVVNIGKVMQEDWDYVRDDIRAVIDVARSREALVKVIFENCFIDDSRKIRLCEICGELEADFVKTSTGYGETGATDHDLALMRKHSPARVQIKAAGGVRDYHRVLAVLALGVTRIGSTSTASILEDARRNGVR